MLTTILITSSITLTLFIALILIRAYNLHKRKHIREKRYKNTQLKPKKVNVISDDYSITTHKYDYTSLPIDNTMAALYAVNAVEQQLASDSDNDSE